jgi:CheY-like chemotaxis protein
MKAPATPGARVLVGDDDADSVSALLALLALEGFTTRGCSNGFEVIEEAKSFGADAVLLDIGMPRIDGYSVARELRKRYAGATPVLIAVTARCTPLDKALSKSAGFDHHVTKPYEPGELIRLLAPLSR